MSPPFRDPTVDLEIRVADLVRRLSLEEKIEMVHQFQPAVARLGIGPYKHGTEAAHGISWLGKATMFPQPIGLAATWDPELLKEVGAAIGDEARGFYRRDPAKNGLTLWAPTVDLERDPRWGRTEEAYGEDPYLVGETAGALVRGIQGDHPVYLRAVATLKHFLGNNHEKDRGTVSATLDPRNLHEYYHQPFERVFRRFGAVSMMTAYNAVNGVPCNLNPNVRREAKKKWGCSFVVSDAGDVIGTNREHHWFETLPEAVAANLKAGIDSITDDREPCLAALRDALTMGLLTPSDLDEAVSNSLRVRLRLGEFDPPGLNPYESLGEEQIGSAEHEALALRTAQQSVVLLQNDGTLPLGGSPSVALVGPLSDLQLRDWYSGEPTSVRTVADVLRERLGQGNMSVESGSDHLRFSAPGKVLNLASRTFEAVDWGWTSHTFRDLDSGLYLTAGDRAPEVTAHEVFGWFTKEVVLADLSGDRAVLASWDSRPLVISSEGELAYGEVRGPEGRIGIDANDDSRDLEAVRADCAELEISLVRHGLNEAVRAAEEAEVAVVVVGNHPLVNAKETKDRGSIDLPRSQVELIRAVASANPRTILVVVSGYPFALDEVLPLVKAVIHVTHCGPTLGQAVVDTLFGDHNPSGRLPMTWYRQNETLPAIEDYDVMRGGRTYRWFSGHPLFPFGHGLSYSNFEYQGIEVQPQAEAIRVQVRVGHGGGPKGQEVVQLYASFPDSAVPRPRRQLVGFQRVTLVPGQVATIEFQVERRELEFWDQVGQDWFCEQGRVVFAAGPSSGDLRVLTSLELTGGSLSARDLEGPVFVESADDHQGLVLEYCREGGSASTFDWARFDRCRFPEGIPKTLELRVSSRKGGWFELRRDRLDGPLMARAEIPPGRPDEVWRTLTVPVQGWSSTFSLFLVSSLHSGREEGLLWFRMRR